MASSLRALLIEDFRPDAELLLRELKRGFDAVEWKLVESGKATEAALATGAWDVVLSDYSLPSFDAVSAMALVKHHDRHMPFIIVSGTIGEETAVEAMKLGADDYVMKHSMTRLVPAIRREIAASRVRRETERAHLALRESERRFSHMLANVELLALMLDGTATVTYCNDFLLRLTGWHREDVVGKSAYTLLPPDAENARALFVSLLADQPSAWHHEGEILTRRGTRRMIRWNNSALRSVDGEVIGTASIGEDITDLRRQMEALNGAHQRLRRMANRMVKLQESERRTLAADLHDYVGQNLSALGVNLGLLEAKGPLPVKPPAAILADSRMLLEDIGRSIRQIITELRPEILDHQGLLAALRWVAERFEERSGVATRVSGSTDRLPLEIEAALLRIAQEALANASKHASARHLSITLSVTPHGATLWIEDDGHGFDRSAHQATDKRQRWGLTMMRERIEAVGGRLRISSRPGKGTRIYAAWRKPA